MLSSATVASSEGAPSAFTAYSNTVVRARPSPASGILPAHEKDEGGSSVLTIKNTHKAAEPSVAGTLTDLPDIPSEVPSSPTPVPATTTIPTTAAATPVSAIRSKDKKADPETVAAAEPEVLEEKGFVVVPDSNPSVIAPRSKAKPAVPTRAPPPLPESSFTHRFTFVKPVGNKIGGVGGVGLIGLGWFSAGNSNSSGLGDGKGKCRVCKHVSTRSGQPASALRSVLLADPGPLTSCSYLSAIVHSA